MGNKTNERDTSIDSIQTEKGPSSRNQIFSSNRSLSTIDPFDKNLKSCHGFTLETSIIKEEPLDPESLGNYRFTSLLHFKDYNVVVVYGQEYGSESTDICYLETINLETLKVVFVEEKTTATGSIKSQIVKWDEKSYIFSRGKVIWKYDVFSPFNKSMILEDKNRIVNLVKICSGSEGVDDLLCGMYLDNINIFVIISVIEKRLLKKLENPFLRTGTGYHFIKIRSLSDVDFLRNTFFIIGVSSDDEHGETNKRSLGLINFDKEEGRLFPFSSSPSPSLSSGEVKKTDLNILFDVVVKNEEVLFIYCDTQVFHFFDITEFCQASKPRNSLNRSPLIIYHKRVKRVKITDRIDYTNYYQFLKYFSPNLYYFRSSKDNVNEIVDLKVIQGNHIFTVDKNNLLQVYEINFFKNSNTGDHLKILKNCSKQFTSKVFNLTEIIITLEEEKSKRRLMMLSNQIIWRVNLKGDFSRGPEYEQSKNDMIERTNFVKELIISENSYNQFVKQLSIDGRVGKRDAV